MLAVARGHMVGYNAWAKGVCPLVLTLGKAYFPAGQKGEEKKRKKKKALIWIHRTLPQPVINKHIDQGTW